MRIDDSRRLTGPSLLLDRPGAILEVALHGIDAERAIAAWREELAALLDGVGWSGATTAARVHAHGVSLAFEAPFDALYAATEVNEAAWHAAAARLGGGETMRSRPSQDPDLEDDARDDDGDATRDEVVARLRDAIDLECNPDLITLAASADLQGATLLSDDKRVSVGLGKGARAWPAEETAASIPRIPWAEIHDVPIALVTGTNGKTTTARLLGAMIRAAGLTAGVTTTDAISVGDEVVAVGDYSGPNGARTVLRDRRVDVAVLEVARGGLLRRGLSVTRAKAAIVTNVAEDHLGEFGVFDLAALADVKMVVAKALEATAGLVLNADDALLVKRGRKLEAERGARVIWFSLDAASPVVVAHLAAGGEACVLAGDELVFAHGATRTPIARVKDVPITFDGAAKHNIANALGAIAVAKALELPDDALRHALAMFGTEPAHNPGRAQVYRLGDVTAIVDYAHNPHGLEALVQLAASMHARRRAVVIGQAGDRDDASVRALAREAAALRPDRVFIKEMDHYLRGRERGVIPAMIEAELHDRGIPMPALVRCGSEMEAIRAALVWAEPGDQLLLTTHESRDDVMALLARLEQAQWQAGDSLEVSARDG